jgi:hypothetical protein
MPGKSIDDILRQQVAQRQAQIQAQQIQTNIINEQRESIIAEQKKRLRLYEELVSLSSGISKIVDISNDLFIQAPIIGTITQPTLTTETGSVDLSGLPTTYWVITASPSTIGLTGLTGSTSTTTIGGLTQETTYTFAVTNNGETSPSTDNVVIDPQPHPITLQAPIIGTITQPTCNINSGSVDLSGLPNVDWILNVSPNTIGLTGLTGSTTTSTVTGLQENTTYTFTISSGILTSENSNPVVIIQQPTTPNAPTIGTITQPTLIKDTGSVILEGLPTEAWMVIVNPNTLGLTGLTGSTSSTNIDGLSANTTYTFTVYNGECISTQSSPVVVNSVPIPVEYYVRPAGTSYGDGSGTSYENAWSGFSAINWSPLEILNVIGTHYEELSVQKTSVTIVGNNINGAGIIDAQSTRVCFRINGYDNIIVNNLSMINGQTSNAHNMLTTGTIYNNCIFDTSGNQTTQHEGNIISDLISVTYNGCTFKNGSDDGVSLHGDNTTVVLNNCAMENNSQGVNAINTGVCIINDSSFLNNVTDVQPDSSSDITVNRSTFRNQLSANSTVPLKINNCTMLSGETVISSGGSIVVSDTKYLGLSKITSNQVDITKVKITRCYFEVSTIAKVTTLNNAVYDLTYSVFKHISGTNVYGASTGGTGTSTINNCTFVGSSSTGRGIAAGGRVNVKNTIFQGLNLVVNPNGANAIVTFEKCCTYLNTTINVNQNGGTFTNTNSVTTNPLITDIVNLNFALQSGSSCWNTGLTLTNSTGILSANWSTGMPTVTTKTQAATWDIGAYIH